MDELHDDEGHELVGHGTGVASVDRVLAEMSTVADLPVAEHVQVFERAHDQLRTALDAQPEAAAAIQQGP